MSRGYPRFLFSNPKNAKDTGPFVVHLLFPKFICKVLDDVEKVKDGNSYYVNVSGWTVELLDVLENEVNDLMRKKVSDAMYNMINWLAKSQ